MTSTSFLDRVLLSSTAPHPIRNVYSALLRARADRVLIGAWNSDVVPDSGRGLQAKVAGIKGKSLVQMGRLQCNVQCGMLSKNRKKIEGVSVFLFEQGVVLCKLNSNDLKKAGKKLQVRLCLGGCFGVVLRGARAGRILGRG